MLDVLNEKSREISHLKSENAKLMTSMQQERQKMSEDLELKVIFLLLNRVIHLMTLV